ncbi:MAG: protein kinase [Candidatus Obscuribacterales bacterium]|nr:protein kinase [Candidatus Obscuribacterales bacterium]
MKNQNEMTEGQDFAFLGERYLDFSPAGKGGMGQVFQAYDQFLKKEVAVKVLIGEQASDRQIMRFQKEAKLASSLAHPNIVKIFDFGVSERQELFLIMDFVRGESLQDLINRNGPLPLQEALGYAGQICDALSHAHSHGVVHRDIKPSNIMLEASERGKPMVKIVDFGLAKQVDDQSGFISQGSTVGTPLYTSPEQVKNEIVDYRSDIYSLGCVLFAMLTGKPPFRGETAMATFEMHVNRDVSEISLDDCLESLSEESREDLEDIIRHSMTKSPDGRYQDIMEFKADLQELMLEETHILKHEDDNLQNRMMVLTLDSLSKPKIGAIVALTVFLLVAVGLQLNLSLSQSAANRAEVRLAPFITSSLDDIPGDIIFRVRRNGSCVWMGSCAMKDEDIKSLKDNKLEALELRGLAMKGTGFKYLAGKTILRLSIRDTKIDNVNLRYLNDIKGLENLDLSYSGVSDEGIANLAPNPGLEGLVLSGCRGITSRSIPLIVERFPNLTGLVLNFTSTDGSELAKLQGLKSLSHLSLTGLKLKDEDVLPLASMKSLLSLNVSNNKSLTDRSVDLLKGSRKLLSLNVINCPGISETATARFQKGHPRCRVETEKSDMSLDAKELANIVVSIIGKE